MPPTMSPTQLTGMLTISGRQLNFHLRDWIFILSLSLVIEVGPKNDVFEVSKSGLSIGHSQGKTQGEQNYHSVL